MTRPESLRTALVAGDLDQLNRGASQIEPATLLGELFRISKDLWSFANSFGKEDLVLTHMLINHRHAFNSFVLDTGRLPAETYDLMELWRQKYSYFPRVYYPEAESVGSYVSENGPNAFYRSVDLRRNCCQIRKIEPLSRALLGKQFWLTGLRAAQSSARAGGSMFATDQAGRIKISPLFYWDDASIDGYISRHKLPYNRLHDQGYPSIGCAPCSRAVAKGEDPRAGRWWWENSHKECGLHSSVVELGSKAFKSEGYHAES